MSNNKIGMGVIGIGLRGQHSYERVFCNDPRIEVRAVSSYPDVNEDLYQGDGPQSYPRYALDFNADYFGEDYQELLQRDDIDLVSLMCQPDKALQLGKECIDANKAFLRDKPVCKTAAEAWELFGLAKDKNVFAALAMPLRYNPSLKHVADNIRAGHHDDILAVTMSYIWPSGPLAGFTASQGYLNSYGGGDVTTAGFHAIDYLNWLIGSDPVEVNCQMDSFFYGDYKKIGMDDFGQIVIIYSSGAIATLLTGRVPSRKMNHSWLDVTTKDGAIEVRDFSSTVDVGSVEGFNEQIIPDDPLNALAKDCLDALQQGNNPPVSIADGAKVLAVLEAASRSASTGKSEEVVLVNQMEVV